MKSSSEHTLADGRQLNKKRSRKMTAAMRVRTSRKKWEILAEQESQNTEEKVRQQQQQPWNNNFHILFIVFDSLQTAKIYHLGNINYAYFISYISRGISRFASHLCCLAAAVDWVLLEKCCCEKICVFFCSYEKCALIGLGWVTHFHSPELHSKQIFIPFLPFSLSELEN